MAMLLRHIFRKYKWIRRTITENGVKENMYGNKRNTISLGNTMVKKKPWLENRFLPNLTCEFKKEMTVSFPVKHAHTDASAFLQFSFKDIIKKIFGKKNVSNDPMCTAGKPKKKKKPPIKQKCPKKKAKKKCNTQIKSPCLDSSKKKNSNKPAHSPCHRETHCKKDGTKSSKKTEKKMTDPCQKTEKKKQDPCKKSEKKKADPCKDGGKKKEDPCKKSEKKKADTCKDGGKKKEDPCKKSQKKKADPCKDGGKKKDPCKDSAKKKADPCKKKEATEKKKVDPCKLGQKKKDDHCKNSSGKKEDPCKKSKKKNEDTCDKMIGFGMSEHYMLQKSVTGIMRNTSSQAKLLNLNSSNSLTILPQYNKLLIRGIKQMAKDQKSHLYNVYKKNKNVSVITEHGNTNGEIRSTIMKFCPNITISLYLYLTKMINKTANGLKNSRLSNIIIDMFYENKRNEMKIKYFKLDQTKRKQESKTEKLYSVDLGLINKYDLSSQGPEKKIGSLLSRTQEPIKVPFDFIKNFPVRNREKYEFPCDYLNPSIVISYIDISKRILDRSINPLYGEDLWNLSEFPKREKNYIGGLEKAKDIKDLFLKVALASTTNEIGLNNTDILGWQVVKNNKNILQKKMEFRFPIVENWRNSHELPWQLYYGCLNQLEFVRTALSFNLNKPRKFIYNGLSCLGKSCVFEGEKCQNVSAVSSVNNSKYVIENSWKFSELYQPTVNAQIIQPDYRSNKKYVILLPNFIINKGGIVYDIDTSKCDNLKEGKKRKIPYCRDIVVQSPMDEKWNAHKKYWKQYNECHKRVKDPTTYRPGADPNGNNLLFQGFTNFDCNNDGIINTVTTSDTTIHSMRSDKWWTLIYEKIYNEGCNKINEYITNKEDLYNPNSLLLRVAPNYLIDLSAFSYFIDLKKCKRKKEGTPKGEMHSCYDPDVESPIDELRNAHKSIWPQYTECHKRVKHPDTYPPGADPNANNMLFKKHQRQSEEEETMKILVIKNVLSGKLEKKYLHFLNRIRHQLDKLLNIPWLMWNDDSQGSNNIIHFIDLKKCKRKREGTPKGEMHSCYDPDVESPIDELRNAHKSIWPQYTECHKRVKHPDTYPPGADPNANNMLFRAIL